MTGRYFRKEIDWAAYQRRLPALIPPPGVQPPEATYNAAPRSVQPILRIAPEQAHIELAPAEWGLVPGWWTKPLSELNARPFTARSRDAPYRPFFRAAFRHHRALVPVSGFYVWTGRAGAKQPFAVGMRDADWFCIAGLWDSALIDGSEIHTFCLLTCQPNDVLAGLATQMPVIIAPKDYMNWLDPMRGGEDLLQPCPAAEMQAWPVGQSVGNVRNNSPDLIA